MIYLATTFGEFDSTEIYKSHKTEESHFLIRESYQMSQQLLSAQREKQITERVLGAASTLTSSNFFGWTYSHLVDCDSDAVGAVLF